MTKTSILVADDDPKIRTLLRRCLEGEAYSVFEAEDEAIALGTLSRESIDLITLDISLGHDNGLEVARRSSDAAQL